MQVKCQVLYSQSGPESQAILTDEETEAQGGEETASWGQSRDPRCVGLGWVWDRGGAVVTRCGGWLAKPQLSLWVQGRFPPLKSQWGTVECRGGQGTWDMACSPPGDSGVCLPRLCALALAPLPLLRSSPPDCPPPP